MKRLLVPALEELSDMPIINDGEPLSEDQVEEMLMQIDQLNAEMKMFFDDEADNEARIEEGEAAIERLENIAEVISKYGISTPIMLIADPYKELISNGVFTVDYESLSDVPVIGDESKAAIEGISIAMEGIWDSIKNMFKKIGKWFYESGVRNEKIFGNFWLLLTDVKNDMSKVKNVSDEKFLSKNIRAYDKNQFNKLLGVFDKVMNTINQSLITGMHNEVDKYFKEDDFNRESAKKASDAIAKKLLTLDIKMIEQNLGVIIDRDDSGHITYVNDTNNIIKDKYDTIQNLGYKSTDTKKVVEDALKLRGVVGKSITFANHLYRFINDNSADAFWNKVETDKQWAELESVWNQYMRAIRAIAKIIAAFWDALQHVCSSATQVGRAYVKAKVA